MMAGSGRVLGLIPPGRRDESVWAARTVGRKSERHHRIGSRQGLVDYDSFVAAILTRRRAPKLPGARFEYPGVPPESMEVNILREAGPRLLRFVCGQAA